LRNDAGRAFPIAHARLSRLPNSARSLRASAIGITQAEIANQLKIDDISGES
jgi:hypothetical protein